MTEETKPTLSEKHLRFVDEYIIDLNATKAYMRVYPDATKESARRLGSQLLTNVDIYQEISKKIAALREMKNIEHERIIREYEGIAFSNLYDLVEVHDDYTSLKRKDDIPEHLQRTVKELEITNQRNENSTIEIKSKIKLHDKVKALDALAKYRELADHSNEEESGPVEYTKSYNKEELRDI